MFKNKKQESNKESEDIDKLQTKLLKSCEALREFAKKKEKNGKLFLFKRRKE